METGKGSKHVVEGACVRCTKGEKTTTLKSTHNTRIGTHLVMLEGDTDSANFAGKFGKCRTLKLPCMRKTLPKWMNTAENFCIEGQPVVTVESFLVCVIGVGAILPVDSGQEHKEPFALPEKYRKEIDKILAGKDNDKADQIRMVYERFLYETNKEAFDEFAKVCAKYERETDERTAADKILGAILQASGIDIRTVVRAMADDILQASPPTGIFPADLKMFWDLVKPEGPADLKQNGIYEPYGVDIRELYNFSVWSRQWESDMGPDYLGNYSFGYFGALFWEGFDFDSITSPIDHPITDLIFPFPTPYLKGLDLTEKSIDVLRAATPGMTDTERFLLFGAGGAQVLDDKDIGKYVGNLISGGYGDNSGDAKQIKDGIEDAYCIFKK